MAVARAVGGAEARLEGCRTVEVDLAELDRIDGAGAVLLARCLDRLDASGRSTRVIVDRNPNAARLITLYRRSRTAGGLAAHPQAMSALTRLGVAVAELPGKVTAAFDFIGRCAAALPKAVVRPRSVDWRSLPRLLQEIGADSLLVTGAANLLVGVIIGLLGVSQLGRFGAVAYVPELVVVAHFRELGPLVTAIVVAGRSGAGLASEIATMKVSEEIDALQAMGFDPVSWLVVPLSRARGDGSVVDLARRSARPDRWSGSHDGPHEHDAAGLCSRRRAPSPPATSSGPHQDPFLALAIGLIACSQGLARGGAAAVGARTTTAVVLGMVSVIVLNALFTFFLALMGI
jgi:phospholipid/cholesterol/gamma-HCH transport system permease protein